MIQKYFFFFVVVQEFMTAYMPSVLKALDLRRPNTATQKYLAQLLLEKKKEKEK